MAMAADVTGRLSIQRKRYRAWRRHSRKLRREVAQWRVRWLKEVERCDKLYKTYMSLLDQMTDVETQTSRRVHFAPAALLSDEQVGTELWRQHVVCHENGTWSYLFEL
jgi:hypothetical protein